MPGRRRATGSASSWTGNAAWTGCTAATSRTGCAAASGTAWCSSCPCSFRRSRTTTSSWPSSSTVAWSNSGSMTGTGSSRPSGARSGRSSSTWPPRPPRHPRCGGWHPWAYGPACGWPCATSTSPSCAPWTITIRR
uniref:Uncharacterized protein n=1 Tax=Ixodes ricinus TaxID=34613 RepID=A0A6B0US67_IXORI